MRHVNLAVEDMFSATHMRLLATCCRLDKMLLASLLLELRAKGVWPIFKTCKKRWVLYYFVTL